MIAESSYVEEDTSRLGDGTILGFAGAQGGKGVDGSCRRWLKRCETPRHGTSHRRNSSASLKAAKDVIIRAPNSPEGRASGNHVDNQQMASNRVLSEIYLTIERLEDVPHQAVRLKRKL